MTWIPLADGGLRLIDSIDYKEEASLFTLHHEREIEWVTVDYWRPTIILYNQAINEILAGKWKHPGRGASTFIEAYSEDRLIFSLHNGIAAYKLIGFVNPAADGALDTRWRLERWCLDSSGNEIPEDCRQAVLAMSDHPQVQVAGADTFRLAATVHS